MAYAKDSAVVILKATEDGYVASYYHWDESPPPVRSWGAITNALDTTGPPLITRQDRISADKADLKTELGQFVDLFFDQ